MSESEASQLIIDSARGYLRGLIDASSEFENRGPDSLPLDAGELSRHVGVAEDILAFEQIIQGGFVHADDLVDGVDCTTHNTSPSGSGSAAVTADATDRTVGDAADTHTTPSGVSADPTGAQS